MLPQAFRAGHRGQWLGWAQPHTPHPDRTGLLLRQVSGQDSQMALVTINKQ